MSFYIESNHDRNMLMLAADRWNCTEQWHLDWMWDAILQIYHCCGFEIAYRTADAWRME